MTIIETKLDYEKEVFSLENFSKLLLKYEETINTKVFMPTPKDQNVSLGATKSIHFKKKFRNHNKTSHDHPRRNTMKYGNNQNDIKDNSTRKYHAKKKFDGKCNFCGIYGHLEIHCYKKKKEENGKGRGNLNNFKGKRNHKSAYVCGIYSKPHTLTNDWVVDSGCNDHMSF